METSLELTVKTLESSLENHLKTLEHFTTYTKQMDSQLKEVQANIDERELEILSIVHLIDILKKE